MGIEYCMWYEMAGSNEDEIRYASECDRYEEGTPACLGENRHTTSATAGDYGPGSPWNAPGMSVKDFI